MMKPVSRYLGAAMLVAAAGAVSAQDHCEGRERHLIYYATHAIAHPVWETVRRGAEAGAVDNCLEFKWTQDVNFSIETTINRMEVAIAEQPDMLVITATDPVAMRPTVMRAVEAGIPIIAINTLDPAPKPERLPYLIGIAAGMYESGQAAAEQVLADNPNIRNAVVPNHAVGHVGLEAMAKGYIDTIIAAGGTAEQIVIGADTGQNTATLSSYMLANPTTDSVFCMESGSLCFEPVLDVARREGYSDQLSLVSFDISPALIESVESGEAVAGIDQLMYMQGYLPAVLTRAYLDYGMMPDTDIMTGPALIDESNIELVRKRVMVDGLN